MQLLSPGSVLGCCVALILCACGGATRLDSNGPGDETAGNAAGGANSAGRGGDERAGGASGGSSAAGASATDVCWQFKDDAPQPVLVTVLNDTPAPLYIGPWVQTCGAQPLFEVRDVSNTPLARPTGCDSPCEGWLLGNPVGGCTAICRPAEVTKLAPGEIVTTHWAGRYMVRAELPRECTGSSLGQDTVSCDLTKRVEPGSFTFYARAGSDFACDDWTGGDCADCEPNAMGGCILRGAIVTGTVNDAQAAVELDASYGVRGSAGGNTPGDGQVQSVELAFRRRL